MRCTMRSPWPQNQHVLKLSRSLTSAVNLGFSADPYSEELQQRALGQHRELIDAIVAGEGEKALHIAAEHFRVTSTEPWASRVVQISTTPD